MQEQKKTVKNMNSIEIGKYRHLARLRKKAEEKKYGTHYIPRKNGTSLCVQVSITSPLQAASLDDFFGSHLIEG